MSPLQLDGYHFLESHFVSKGDGFAPTFGGKATGLAAEGIVIVVTLGHQKDDLSKWRCNMVISSNESDELPCSFSLKIEGYFTVAAPIVERGEAEKLIGITGASILYSAAREHILCLTTRGPHHGLMLPTVSFTRAPSPKSEEEIKSTQPSSPAPLQK